LSGHGETLLHRDFTYMLQQTALAGCQVSFQTNGMLLSDAKIEEMIRLGVSYITFSLDAASRRQKSLSVVFTNGCWDGSLIRRDLQAISNL
jgi:MoaA/NifB/PqqE/SkfB family radical SAM enzyme